MKDSRSNGKPEQYKWAKAQFNAHNDSSRTVHLLNNACLWLMETFSQKPKVVDDVDDGKEAEEEEERKKEREKSEENYISNIAAEIEEPIRITHIYLSR